MTRRIAPVSVVIPFYGGTATLGRAIRSLEAQTVRPSEILVVDDASPTPLPPLESVIPLRVLRHDRNRGIPSARNTGIRAASGDWIGFLDQDDEWVPDKLERQWALGREVDSGVVFGRLLHTGQGRPPWIWPPAPAIPALERGGKAAMKAFVRWGNAAPMVTLLVPRQTFEQFGLLDEDFTGGSDDMELLLRLTAEGVPFRACRGGTGYSAIHHFTGSNYSGHAPRFLRDDLRLIRTLARRYPLIDRYRDRLLARTRYTLGRHHDRSGCTPQARLQYRRAVRLDPAFLRPRLAQLWLALPQWLRDAATAARERWRARSSRGLRQRG